MRVIKFFLIYFILIVYSVEFLLFTFTTSKQKSMVNIESARIEIAKILDMTQEAQKNFFFKIKKH